MPAHFDAIPLALLPVLWLAILVFASELGYRLGSRREAAKGVGAVVGANLALVGFLLAFTFSMAASQHSDRRAMVLKEANAVGTAWLRSDLLPEPHRSATRAFYREYVEVRLAAARGTNLGAAMRRSEEIHGQLWSSAIAAIGTGASPAPLSALYIASLNEVIDLHSDRLQIAIRTRVAPTIWLALFGVTVISMATLGFQIGGSGKRNLWALFGLSIPLVMVVALIADLDRPQQGLMRVAQTPLEELLRTMVESPPR